jgi:hypothetical protein
MFSDYSLAPARCLRHRRRERPSAKYYREVWEGYAGVVLGPWDRCYRTEESPPGRSRDRRAYQLNIIGPEPHDKGVRPVDAGRTPTENV